MTAAKIFRFKGGFHPEDHKKLSSEHEVKTLGLLPRYTVLLRQNVGAPPEVCVTKGDHVKKGSCIAQPSSFVSVPLHSPVSGTVGDLLTVPGPNGSPVEAVEILSDGEDMQEWDDRLEPILDWRDTPANVLKKRILDAGITGMGGAAFPTHVKLSPPPEKPVDTLILNGAECEPYLTSDDVLMRSHARAILTGAAIAAKVLGVTEIFVGIEDNKKEAFNAMEQAAWGISSAAVTVVPLPVKYPQGGEKQLIYALTGRKVIVGALPMDVGCAVLNVGSCYAIWDAVLNGHPLVERITTVTGTPVVNPGNYRILMGTPLSAALEGAGGIRENSDVGKIIFGGPMMGFAQYSLEVPVSKNTSGILLLDRSEVAQFYGGPCLSCGRCVEHCPMQLPVSTLSKACESERYDLAKENHVLACLECGVCSSVCPARRPNVQHFRKAKAELKELLQKEKNKKVGK